METEKQSQGIVEYTVVQKKPSLLRQMGCGFMLVIWFVMLLLPFAMIVLAVEGQIRIGHSGDIPDRHEHPLLQIDLLTEIDYRGLQITRTSVNEKSGEICLETRVSYILWQGTGEPATYCDCYERDATESVWQLRETILAGCK